MSPPIPAQRSTTIGLAWNRIALYRATGSAVACSTPTGSTHIRSPRSNFPAAFRRASVSRTAAETIPAGASFRSRSSSAGPIDRTAATSSSNRRPMSVVKDPELVVDAGIVLASCSGRVVARMRMSHAFRIRNEEHQGAPVRRSWAMSCDPVGVG